ncbi:hypothetical protein LY78DRAFT_415091 [Colletotrichum sublineola]|nr:hypothetical protein LY78DRAFT_415091 [Colletotrichum sublineola]
MIPIRLLTVLGLAGIVTAFPQMTTEPPSPPTAEPTPIEACSTRTICRDFINECGQMYEREVVTMFAGPGRRSRSRRVSPAGPPTSTRRVDSYQSRLIYGKKAGVHNEKKVPVCGVVRCPLD